MTQEIGIAVKTKRKKLKLSVAALSKALDVSVDAFYKWEKGTRPSNPVDYRKLEDFLKDTWKEPGQDFSSELTRDELGPPYIKMRWYDKLEDVPFMVPMVPYAAKAGYAQSYNSDDFLGALDHFPILPNVPPVGLVWRYFEISGYSMEPELSDKDIVLCSLVNREDWRDMKPYYTYVIVTENDVLVKRVFCDIGFWYLLSVHRPSGHKKINRTDIKEVWAIRRHVRNKIPVTEQFDIKEIKKQLSED